MSFMQDCSIFVKCVHCVAKVKNPNDVILKEILPNFVYLACWLCTVGINNKFIFCVRSTKPFHEVCRFIITTQSHSMEQQL